MSKVKLLVLYYSATGTNYQMAQWALEGANETGAETRLRKFKETAPKEAVEANEAWKEFSASAENQQVQEVSLEDLEWADAIVFSIPTRYGNFPSQVQSFFDTTGGLWFQGKLTNKVVSGMTSAQNMHGGQETTIMSLYKTMCHWGCIIVPPGYTSKASFTAGGNPYGTSTSADDKGKMNRDVQNAVREQVKRTATVASWLLKGKEE